MPTRSITPRNPAAAVFGIESSREKRAASGRRCPSSRTIVIVMPDRLTPDTSANTLEALVRAVSR